jgi:hypothetical protein
MLPDTSNVPDSNYETLPAGWYTVTLTDTEEKTSKNGKDYLNVEFRTMEEKPIWDKCFYNEEALWKLKSLKKAIGMADTETHIESYHGVKLQIKVKVRIYEGDEQNEVERYKAIEGTVLPPKAELKPAPVEDDESLPF